MRIRVDLIPKPEPSGVVVLIDALRTCTVAPILFDNGLERLALSTGLKLARRVAGEESALLLGERNGLPPEGFNHGNSPADLEGARFDGRSAVLVSENAPARLAELHGAPRVLLGALYNAEAVVERALAIARAEGRDELAFVGCGFDGQEDLDDAVTAGYLAALALDAEPDAEPVGATRMAMALVGAFPDPEEAFWRSIAGRYLRGLGLEDDIAVACRVGWSRAVPELVGSEERDGRRLFRFRNAGA